MHYQIKNYITEALHWEGDAKDLQEALKKIRSLELEQYGTARSYGYAINPGKLWPICDHYIIKSEGRAQ